LWVWWQLIRPSGNRFGLSSPTPIAAVSAATALNSIRGVERSGEREIRAAIRRSEQGCAEGSIFKEQVRGISRDVDVV